MFACCSSLMIACSDSNVFRFVYAVRSCLIVFKVVVICYPVHSHVEPVAGFVDIYLQ